MKSKCIIVDDEKTARNIIKSYIMDCPSLKLVGEFKNALEVLGFIAKNKVDVIFLDIEMPKLSGINLAKLIDDKTKIIFTTAHREFAIEGFELNATDYLLKPFSFERFLKAIQKTKVKSNNNVSSENRDYIYLKIDKLNKRVNFSDLLYIEGLSNYVKICTKKENLVAYYKLSDLETLLPSKFLRIHKSYIINTSLIKEYSKEFVIINGKHIPISLTYRERLLELLKNN